MKTTLLSARLITTAAMLAGVPVAALAWPKPVSLPEPGMLALLSLGLTTLGAYKWRRRSR